MLLEELLTAEPLLQQQYCVVTLPFSLRGSSRIRGEQKHTENPRSNLALKLRSGLDAKQGKAGVSFMATHKPLPTAMAPDSWCLFSFDCLPGRKNLLFRLTGEVGFVGDKKAKR